MSSAIWPLYHPDITSYYTLLFCLLHSSYVAFMLFFKQNRHCPAFSLAVLPWGTLSQTPAWWIASPPSQNSCSNITFSVVANNPAFNFAFSAHTPHHESLILPIPSSLFLLILSIHHYIWYFKKIYLLHIIHIFLLDCKLHKRDFCFIFWKTIFFVSLYIPNALGI